MKFDLSILSQVTMEKQALVVRLMLDMGSKSPILSMHSVTSVQGEAAMVDRKNERCGSKLRTALQDLINNGMGDQKVNTPLCRVMTIFTGAVNLNTEFFLHGQPHVYCSFSGRRKES